MYKGFNLTIQFSNQEIENFYDHGVSHLNSISSRTRSGLRRLVYENKTINASQLESDWFPDIYADVFVSHSHLDEKSAITLSGFLNQVFGLNCFVDSIVWHCSDELQQLLDTEFCFQPHTGNYNYSLRNITTTHVHIMLAASLAKMMNKTECLIFLNTPNSVKIQDHLNKTQSAWLYFETGMSSWIRRAPLAEYRSKISTRKYTDHFEKALNESFEYPLDLDHLTSIDKNDLIKWQEKYNKEKYPLDVFYKLQSIG